MPQYTIPMTYFPTSYGIIKEALLLLIRKKRYIILDTVSLFPTGNSQHLECFDKGGWDLLHVYAGKTLVKSTVIDRECLLESHAENELEMHLQHDITLLWEHVPDFYKYRVDADKDVSEGH